MKIHTLIAISTASFPVLLFLQTNSYFYRDMFKVFFYDFIKKHL